MAVFSRDALDRLTGIPNRDGYYQRASKYVARKDVSDLSAVYMRVINFGAYSIRYGSKAGDKVLKQIGELLGKMVPTKVIGRFESSGGFAALTKTSDVEGMLEAINRELPTAGEADGLMLKVSIVQQILIDLVDADMVAAVLLHLVEVLLELIP